MTWWLDGWGECKESELIVWVFVFQNGEVSMLGEVTHLQAIMDDLSVLITDPHKLPEASEQVLF